jgi:hypothetical protein
MDSEVGRRFAEAMEDHNSPIKAVPDDYSEEAERLLAEKESIFVDMQKASPLVDWAKSQRNQPHPDGNRKHRRQMAKQSRKKNR